MKATFVWNFDLWIKPASNEIVVIHPPEAIRPISFLVQFTPCDPFECETLTLIAITSGGVPYPKKGFINGIAAPVPLFLFAPIAFPVQLDLPRCEPTETIVLAIANRTSHDVRIQHVGIRT